MTFLLALNLSDPDDSQSEVLVANTIKDLVNGSKDAATAARAIDQVIVSESHGSLKPSGWQKYLWDCLGKAAMAVPFDHDGQGCLVALLQELQHLPRHEVPQKIEGEILQKQLWVLTRENKYDGLEQWLWELDQGE